MRLRKILGACLGTGLLLGMLGTTVSLPAQAESDEMRALVRDLQAMLQASESRHDDYYEDASESRAASTSAGTPRIGNFRLYSQDTPAVRKAIAALQKVVIPAYSKTTKLDMVFKRYSHCKAGTKGYVFRTYEKSGRTSVSFRCDLDLRQQYLRSVQRPEITKLLKETFYPFFAQGAVEEMRSNRSAAAATSAQQLNASFDAILKASLQPRTITLEYEFYRSPIDPDTFPEYRAGFYVDFADNVSGYTDFVSDNDFAKLQDYVDFDEITALYANKNLIGALLESEPSHGILFGTLLINAYCDGL